jgi:hypothetical protein
MPAKCERIPCTCQCCSCTFLRIPSQVGNYCSKPCQHMARRDPLRRFWSRVRKTDGCWDWTGAPDNKGYGHISIERRKVLVHRFVYALERGAIPAGIDVLHSCDNRACVNPDHLFLGTQVDNTRDMIAKGRHARGERMGNTHLTDADAQRIRELHRQGLRPKQLSAMFDVTPQVVGNIVAHRTWRHLP